VLIRHVEIVVAGLRDIEQRLVGKEERHCR
jgi:hypothetical protein